MIKLDIPRHNVSIGTYCLNIKFNYANKILENGEEIYFLIEPKHGQLNKRPDGWWYFTIYIEKNRQYTYVLQDNIRDKNRYVTVSGEEFVKLINNWIKWEKENYN